MNEVEMKIIEVEGKKYFLVDSFDINNSSDKYYFFAELDNQKNILILKDGIEDGEEALVSLDSQEEIDEALKLFSSKYVD